MTIKEKLSHLEAINIEKLFDDILRENESIICDMNRKQLYDDGSVDVNNPGKKEKYSPLTALAKRTAPYNKTDFITLKWKGDFHDSLKITIFKDKFIIHSKNLVWANYLEPQSRFGSALGLTKKSKSGLRDLAKKEMIKKIHNAL